MSQLAAYRQTTGEITQLYSAPIAELLTYTFPDGIGAMLVDLNVDPRTHYVDVASEAVVEMPPRPSVDHQWDWSTHTWTATLADALERRLTELRVVRERKVNATFTWSGHEFDSDAIAQTRLMGAYVSAVNTPAVFPQNWRLADNTWLTLTAVDMVGVWAALQMHIAMCFSVFAAHETAIKALTTVSAVQAYDMTAGW